MKKILVAVMALALFIPTVAQATISVGGYQFFDNAFVDSLVNSSGVFSTSGGTLAQVLTDKSEATYAFSFTPGAFVTLAFTDNKLVNGQANDLAIFELGVPDTINVTIGATTLPYLTAATGFNAGGFALNVALVNLDAFGVPFGGTVNVLTLGMDTIASGGTVPSVSLVGALNSCPPPVPIPGTLLLLGSGMLGLVGLRLRRK
jgi:hypothetical protein